MKAVIFRTNKRIEPFLDPAGETLILDRRLDDWRDEAVRGCGIEPVYGDAGDLSALGEDALFLHDNLFFTPRFLMDFLKGAESSPGSSAAALAESLYTRLTAPLQDNEKTPDGGGMIYPLYYIRKGGAFSMTREGLMEGPLPILIDQKVQPWRVEKIPKNLVEEGFIEIPATSRAVMKIEHWVHILRANLLALTAMAVSEKESFEGMGRMKRALRCLPFLATGGDLFKIMERMSRKGKGTLIHPTARVEASILGDGVRVGAFAMVRGSYVGNGARIDDYAQVYFSVLGEGATVSRMAQSNFCVLYPGSFVSHIGHQASLLGRDAFTSQEMAIYDMRMDGGEVRVMHRGEERGSGSPFLGACIGHRTKIGAGVFVNYGLAVPNDLFIVGPPSNILRDTKLPEGYSSGEALRVKEGRLESIRR